MIMVDLLNIEVNIGDKVAFLPHKDWRPTEIQYGIVEKMAKGNGAAWCKSLNSEHNLLLRYGHQLIKLN